MMSDGETAWPVICPHCARPLRTRCEDERLRSLDCPEGHRFDAAKQGYVNLLVGRGSSLLPDTAEMIMARERVQRAGLFDALTQHLSTVLDRHAPQAHMILDAGAGTGHHLHRLLDDRPEARGVALDLSPAGLRRAARHRRTLALGWDLWRPLPVRDDGAAVVLNVFAPHHPEEFARVLRPGGIAVVVTPRPGHLAELAGLGLLSQQSAKQEQLLARFLPHLGEPVETSSVSSTLHGDAQTAADLVTMGPAGHHRSAAEILAEVQRCPPETVSADLDVTVWRR